MADFTDAFNRVIEAEGGLVNNPSDKGGQTYCGISRKFNPQWDGWKYVDSIAAVPQRLVIDFYRDNYWIPLRLDSVLSQKVANAVFSYAVNAGIKPAVKMAQTVAAVTPDGIVGKITLFALNSIASDLFLARFALARIQHRVDVCRKDPSQKVFLLGWISRDLKESA